MSKKRFFKYTILTGLTLVFLAGIGIAIYGLGDRLDRADVMVVLGNKVELDGAPSDRLQARLDRAANLYASGMASKVIVSGAKGKEGFEEAEVMADYLAQNGVRERDIIIDNEGANTYLTAKNTRTIMDRYNFKSVIVVSHYYHLLRCKLAFSNWGVSTVYTARNVSNFQIRDVYSIFREVVGLAYYAVRSYSLPDTSKPASSQAPMPPFKS